MKVCFFHNFLLVIAHSYTVIIMFMANEEYQMCSTSSGENVFFLNTLQDTYL